MIKQGNSLSALVFSCLLLSGARACGFCGIWQRKEGEDIGLQSISLLLFSKWD